MLDTNVVASSFLVPQGAPAHVVERWRQHAFTVLVSEPILSEYERVLHYPRLRARHGMTSREITEVVEGLRLSAHVVDPGQRLHVVADDPDDDKFLECAVEGGARYVVTGDAHLLAVGEYAGIHILSPAAFLALPRDEATD